MIYNLLSSALGAQNTSLFCGIGILLAFLFTLIVLKFGQNMLPVDGGRLFAHDGISSKGKPRGAGIIFVLVFSITVFLFAPLTAEIAIYLALTIAAMLTGYFDDSSKTPWGPLKKGIMDFAIAVVTAITYVNFNGSALIFRDTIVEVPSILFIILGVVLVWVAINVTNCSDGVDGLSGTLTIITLGGFYIVSKIMEADAGFGYVVLVFIFTIIAYLWFNATPSILMMGDAGSRAMGIFIAITAMKSGNALLFIPLAFMLIIDGGAGLIKLSFGRFLKIKIMKNIRTPIHDHYRKNKAWSNTQVVFRFAIIQIVVTMVTIYLVK